MIIIITVLPYAFYQYHREAEHVKEIRADVIAYLDEKYDQAMVLDDEWGYYDSMYSFFFRPIETPEIYSAVRYFSSEHIIDDYLNKYAGWEAANIIKKIVDKYCFDSQCIAFNYGGLENDERLEEYYLAKRKPLSWNDLEHLDALQYAGIEVYKDNGDVTTELFTKILDELKTLDFTIETVKFKICNNSEERKVIEDTIVYEFNDGEYLRR